MGTQLALLDVSAATQVTPSVAQMFEKFWRVYPKRSPYSNPKHPALLKFTTLVTRHKVDPLKIIAGAARYAALRSGDDPKFTAMAVTWLNQHRWEDDHSGDSGDPGAGRNHNSMLDISVR